MTMCPKSKVSGGFCFLRSTKESDCIRNACHVSLVLVANSSSSDQPNPIRHPTKSTPRHQCMWQSSAPSTMHHACSGPILTLFSAPTRGSFVRTSTSAQPTNQSKLGHFPSRVLQVRLHRPPGPSQHSSFLPAHVKNPDSTTIPGVGIRRLLSISLFDFRQPSNM